MKLVTFVVADGSDHIGALLDDMLTVSDFTASSDAGSFRSMLALIDGGPDALAQAREFELTPRKTVSLDAVRLRSPVPEPRQMRDFLAFERHVRQARAHRHLFGIMGGSTDPAKI
jgi:hypothetical protein